MTADQKHSMNPSIQTSENLKNNQIADEPTMAQAFGGKVPPSFEEGGDEYLEPGETPQTEEMDALMDQYLDQMGTDLNQGQTLKVTVVAIKEDGVLVDLGEKSEGYIPLREFPVVGDVPQVKIGDEIEVVVKGYDAGMRPKRLSRTTRRCRDV
jgi:transcriptional accessory protein Tex/SPT6